MNFLKQAFLTLLTSVLLFTGWPTISFAQGTVISPDDGQCIESFASFAFRSSYEKPGIKATKSPRWQKQATVPTRGFEDELFDEYLSLNVSLTRLINGNHEVWITGQSWTKEFEIERVILVYSPSSQGWTFVSAEIGDTSLYVTDLFADSKGNIWGEITYGSVDSHPVPQYLPVLVKFDDATR